MDGILSRYLWSHGFYRSNDSIQNERRIVNECEDYLPNIKA
jgi:hypothetical protein